MLPSDGRRSNERAPLAKAHGEARHAVAASGAFLRTGFASHTINVPCARNVMVAIRAKLADSGSHAKPTPEHHVSDSWTITAHAAKSAVQTALLAHEDAADWDAETVLSGREAAADTPDEWILEAWLSRRPTRADKTALAALFPAPAPLLRVRKVPEQDWVMLSQQGVKPIQAGRFYVHTPDYPASTDRTMRSLTIPASQAFGTGQHETTAGCLTMLTAIRARGEVARKIADIGTGTGLLAFAAMDLWPRAQATASDVDGICADVVAYNAAQNQVATGAGSGALTMIVADGMANPLLQARGPYDLLIANILAAPLIELAPDFAQAVRPRGNIVLAGLLATQEAKVRKAYFRAGFRLAARLVNGGWSILWLRRRGLR